jgi:hypothetical protein
MTKNKFKSLKKGLTREEVKKMTNEELDEIIKDSLNRIEKMEELCEKFPWTEKAWNSLTKDERLQIEAKAQIPSDFYDIRHQCFKFCINHLDLRRECCLWLIGYFLMNAYLAGEKVGLAGKREADKK